jgi:hypothetical protein
MTIDPNEVADEVLALAKGLTLRGAAAADLGTALLRIAIVTLHRHDLQARKAAGAVALPKLRPEQVQEIVLAAMELIGERLDDAEADLAERN